MSRRIAVITGTRAEYGLLSGLMRELQTRGAELQLIVTGTHLSAAHGMTVSQIENDGFPIAARVDIGLAGDAPTDITRSMGLALSGIAAELARLKPEIVVILGDRYEMLAAASAAAMLGIPIAHLHGGEVTEGAIDESLRHAITKLSYWHFASAEAYAKRITQLGEDPARVFTVGAPGIDNIACLKLLPREELAKELGIELKSPVILFTYHPETLGELSIQAQIEAVLAALNAFADATLLLTGANADSGGQAVNAALQVFAAGRKNTLFRVSYGSLLYMSAMAIADVVLGNSSSGVIEAPALGRATVNIGDRQTGRLRAPTIIDCASEKDAIIAAVKRALSAEFQATLKPQILFGTPGKVAPKIAEILCSAALPATARKAFYDIP